ncbi:GAK10 protein, partial [Irena cyanogastra]|nr:GAK10 protein [Irena cyanogastra]
NRADVELSDYIKAGINISSEQYKAELIATVIAQQLRVARAAIKCFECRELGHIRKQCPKGQKGNKKPRKPFNPIKPCPHCQKGFHWSNQCWTMYDKDSNILLQQGNSKGRTWSGAPQSNKATLRHQYE